MVDHIADLVDSSLLKVVDKSSCLYLPGEEQTTLAFLTRRLKAGLYESLMLGGFRRSGFIVYRHICQPCKACIPIRIKVSDFKYRRSQKRVLKINQDVIHTLSPVMFRARDFELYQDYCTARHDHTPFIKDYTEFLIDTPVDSQMIHYYDKDRLIAIGWIDILPNSISSVYLAFDPDQSYRSLGVFNVLKQIELCRQFKKTWLYLGFWIKTCKKMSYKTQYRPYELLLNGQWTNPSDASD